MHAFEQSVHISCPKCFSWRASGLRCDKPPAKLGSHLSTCSKSMTWSWYSCRADDLSQRRLPFRRCEVRQSVISHIAILFLQDLLCSLLGAFVAAHGPTMLLFDDLHLFDRLSLQLLADVASMPRSACLVIATRRPDYRTPLEKAGRQVSSGG